MVPQNLRYLITEGTICQYLFSSDFIHFVRHDHPDDIQFCIGFCRTIMGWFLVSKAKKGYCSFRLMGSPEVFNAKGHAEQHKKIRAVFQSPFIFMKFVI